MSWDIETNLFPLINHRVHCLSMQHVLEYDIQNFNQKNLKRTNHVREPDFVGRIILKWIFKC
jgi:hypothetical protein